MIEVQEQTTADALNEWSAEIVRHPEMWDAQSATQLDPAIPGAEWIITGNRPSPHPAEKERFAISDALVTELTTRRVSRSIYTLLIFEKFWKPASVVNRRLGMERLIERFRASFGVDGRLIDASCVEGEEGIRWCVALELGREDLSSALGALESEEAALTVSSVEPDSAEDLFRDLIENDAGALAVFPLWAFWTARRIRKGDLVVLADELTDHTGRRAFLLG